MADRVRVLLFATAREAVGRSSLSHPVPSGGIGLDELLEDLATEHPRLRPVLRISRIVRNGEFLRGRGVRIDSGDEIAIHPPYSGG